MGSGNWIVDNLNFALSTWNDKLTDIWTPISTSPENFRGCGVWTVIVNINGGLKAVGYALLVLFFVMGVVKTMASFAGQLSSSIGIAFLKSYAAICLEGCIKMSDRLIRELIGLG